MKRYILLLLFSMPVFSFSQVVYEDINNVGIYEFLDELANLKVITLNSVVKPYSRGYIAEKLEEAMEYSSGEKDLTSEPADQRTSGRVKKRYELNKRQRK